MSAPLFLVPELPRGEHHRLTGPEGHHAAAVQRLCAGESLLLGDGAGGIARCEVTGVDRAGLDVRVKERVTVPAANPRLRVVQAIAKGDRGELAVQAMTEVGADAIVPWSAARSVVRWQGERGERAARRWRVTAREAAKQARRAWLPDIPDAADTKAVCRAVEAASAAYVLHEEAAEPLAAAPLPAEGEILLLVGPEGGVTPEELEAFIAAGARSVRLGAEVLRTSTAGVAALSVVNARTARWG